MVEVVGEPGGPALVELGQGQALGRRGFLGVGQAQGQRPVGRAVVAAEVAGLLGLELGGQAVALLDEAVAGRLAGQRVGQLDAEGVHHSLDPVAAERLAVVPVDQLGRAAVGPRRVGIDGGEQGLLDALAVIGAGVDAAQLEARVDVDEVDQPGAEPLAGGRVDDLQVGAPGVALPDLIGILGGEGQPAGELAPALAAGQR